MLDVLKHASYANNYSAVTSIMDGCVVPTENNLIRNGTETTGEFTIIALNC